MEELEDIKVMIEYCQITHRLKVVRKLVTIDEHFNGRTSNPFHSVYITMKLDGQTFLEYCGHSSGKSFVLVHHALGNRVLIFKDKTPLFYSMNNVMTHLAENNIEKMILEEEWMNDKV